MVIDYGQMVKENIEGHSDFNIKEDWYTGRKMGLSAVIRCYGEERWIGTCIESCLPLYDEVLVTLTDVEGDRTEEIIKSFHSSKLRILRYPFKINKKYIKHPMQNVSYRKNCYSVHQFSYYTNWGLSHTRYSHVSSRWDADHILRPEYATKKFHDFVVSKANVRVRGCNVVTPDFHILSRQNPYQTFHVRFAKVHPYLYFTGNSDDATYYGLPQLLSLKHWHHFPVQQTLGIFNRLMLRDARVSDPIFFHTKFLKIREKNLSVKDKFHTGISEEDLKGTPTVLLPGEKISYTIPDCVFKTPDDYLS